MRSRTKTSRSTQPPCGVAACHRRRTPSPCRPSGYWTTSTTSTVQLTCCRARSSAPSTSGSGSATPRARPSQDARNTHAILSTCVSCACTTHALCMHLHALCMHYACTMHALCMHYACTMHALRASPGPGPCRRPLPRPLRHWACRRRRARVWLAVALVLLRTLALVGTTRAALRVLAGLRHAAASIRPFVGSPTRAAPAPSTLSAGQLAWNVPLPPHTRRRYDAVLALPPPCPLATRGGGAQCS